jgi:hypothetical protein
MLTGVVCRAADKDAVLAIWAASAEGKTWVGTGFLVNADGQFITCYHVVRDAVRVTVYRGKEAYSDVQVLAIAPEHDLALLQITGLPSHAIYLSLSDDPPSRFNDQELQVHGNPNGLPGQQFTARTTSEDFLLSGEFRSQDGGDRIFAIQDVKLIPLNMTIFKGLSGGPVVSKSGVVGVISGSFKEGGTIAWAIPATYAFASKMKPIDRPLRQMGAWPELSLMRNSGWNTLRFDFSITAGLALALDSYTSGVEEFDGIARSLLLRGPQELAQLLDQFIKDMVAFEAHPRDPDALKRITPYTEKMSALKLDIATRLKTLEEKQSTLIERFANLTSQVREFQRQLPDSPKNRERIAKAGAGLLGVSTSLLKGGTDLIEIQKGFSAKLESISVRLKKRNTLGSVRKILIAEKQIMNDAARQNEQPVESILRSYREIGNVAEALLDSEDAVTSVQSPAR